MDDVNELTEQPSDEQLVADAQCALNEEPAPPIHSRFLFVDVAALRAKQLRRGARVRFDAEGGVVSPHKPERVAMEEVRRGLVYYNVPEWKGLPAETEA
jgi:DNA-directed RNA polymerase subunit K/omega